MIQPKMFKRRPEPVEAMFFDGTNGSEVAAWCGGEYFHTSNEVRFPTMSGIYAAYRDHYIIRNLSDGTLDMIAKAPFEKIYEETSRPNFSFPPGVR